jgi:hypothetical protein
MWPRGVTDHFVTRPDNEEGERAVLPVAPTPPARDAGPQPLPDRVLALHRTAGNRAVARLVESGRTLSRAPARTPQRRKGRGLKVTVKADHAMRGDEIGIAVLQQIYGDTPDRAARRLEEWKADGY